MPLPFAIAASWLLVFFYGNLELALHQWRTWRERSVYPVPGLTVSSVRTHASLTNLQERAGASKGLVWALTQDGIVCRGPHIWLVIGRGRQVGGAVVVDAVLPRAIVVMFAGLVGFFATLAVIGATMPAGRPERLIPVVPLLVSVGIGWLTLAHARASGRVFARYIAALCDEPSTRPAAE